MGGRPCIIIQNSIIQFTTISDSSVTRKLQESKLRSVYANPIIAEAVDVEHEEAVVEDICARLKKVNPTKDDLEFLLAKLPTYTEETTE